MPTQLSNPLAGFHERQAVRDRAGHEGVVVAVCDRMVCVRFAGGERRWLFPHELAPAGALAAAA